MYLALLPALLCAFADWFAVARQHKTLEYIFKPATMLAVIAAVILFTRGPHDAWLAQWFFLGFIFSLAGDIFLMIPQARWFLFGLVAFLFAHLAYIVGLNPTPPPPASLVILIPCLIAGVAAASGPLRVLRAQNQTKMIPPVIVYAVAITLMLFSAWATLFRPEWNETRRLWVIGGATLFFVSDTILAWNRFVKPFAHARVATMVTYHLGQIALAAAIVV